MANDEKDGVTVGVRMTRAERERIRKAADSVGVGLSTYLRMKALEAERRAIEKDWPRT